MIPETAREQHEGAERKQIRIDGPRQTRGACVQIERERRQCHVDDRTIDEGQARAESRSGQCRARVLGGRRDSRHGIRVDVNNFASARTQSMNVFTPGSS